MKKTVFLLLLVILLCGCQTARETPEEIIVPQTTDAPEPAPEPSESKEPYVFTFSAEDRQGNTWTQEDFADYKAVMINFWEPWCGPCVGEMPDLQKLYEAYSDQGFLILGVYSTLEPDEDIAAVLEKCGTTYPILKYSPDFDILQTGYVPNTVFFDSQGHLLAKPFSGAMSYDEWAEIVELLV